MRSPLIVDIHVDGDVCLIPGPLRHCVQLDVGAIVGAVHDHGGLDIALPQPEFKIRSKLYNLHGSLQIPF